MNPLEDNSDEVLGQVEAIVAALNFEATAGGKLLGEELLDEAAMAILSRSIAQEAPGGSIWPANARAYADHKARRGVQLVGVGVSKATEENPASRMLSLPQLQGRRTITPDSAEAEFGLDDAANRKGQRFTAGSAGEEGCEPSGAKNQPPRPFFDLDEADREAIGRRAEELLDQLLSDLGA